MPLARNNNEHWTYADYLILPDDERWEIIDGVPYAMSPARGTLHQRISRTLSLQIGNFLHGKPCELFVAPYDVRLSERTGLTDEKVETVVQPDLLVVCDKARIDERGCNGAPDLIIEITSPSTGCKDLTVKFDLYQRYGVKEYWIIHPEEQTVMVFRLQENKKYGVPERFGRAAHIAVPLLGDLLVDLADLFAE